MLKSITCALALFLIAGAAAAQAPPFPVRSFEHFEMDPQIATGLWVEPMMRYRHGQDRWGNDLDRVATGPRMAFGLGVFEVGAMLPYYTDVVDGGTDLRGFGDVSIYGKLVPIQSEAFSAGLGMVLITPSGDETHFHGYGEVGFEPFGTVGIRMPGGPLEFRASGGRRFFADDAPVIAPGYDTAPGSWFYRGGLFLSASDRLGIQIEFVGETIDQHHDSNPMAIEPGVTIRVPLKGFELNIRPTGLIGIKDHRPSVNEVGFDYGFGVGMAVLWGAGQPSAAARKAQPF